MEQALGIGAFVRFRAEGTSMYPTIRDGELITVVRVTPKQVVRGDVLLCRQHNRMLAHRVVGLGDRAGRRVFRLQGDAKAACDAPIGARDVVGKVVSVYRNGREVRLCGNSARLRHAVRTAAARARTLIRG